MGLFDFLKKEKEIILGVEFPMFSGKKKWPGTEFRNTRTYKRKDFYYVQDLEKLNSYIALICSYGFCKVSDIKYTKNNSYIIVENKKSTLHIAFHVNK